MDVKVSKKAAGFLRIGVWIGSWYKAYSEIEIVGIDIILHKHICSAK